MRYTESKHFLSEQEHTGILKELLYQWFTAPFRLIDEITKKLLFMERNHIEKLLFVSIVSATAMMVLNVVLSLIFGSVKLWSGSTPLMSYILVIFVVIGGYFLLTSEVKINLSRIIENTNQESQQEEMIEDVSEDTEQEVVTQLDTIEELVAEEEYESVEQPELVDELDQQVMYEEQEPEVEVEEELGQQFEVEELAQELDEVELVPESEVIEPYIVPRDTDSADEFNEEEIGKLLDNIISVDEPVIPETTPSEKEIVAALVGDLQDQEETIFPQNITSEEILDSLKENESSTTRILRSGSIGTTQTDQDIIMQLLK